MASKYFFSLKSLKPCVENEAGSLTYATAKQVPGFVNIAFANLKLKKMGSLEPIWHPNANKIGYCTAGKGFVSMRTPGTVENYTVEKGEIFFIPKGFVHRIENIGEEDCVINFALDNDNPDKMFFSKAIRSISDSVFNSTFDTKSDFIAGLKKSGNNDLLKKLPKQTKISQQAANKYKFDIEDSKKTIVTKGGYLQLGVKQNLSVLNGLGILGFGLNQKGIVEPHWHTNAGELVYIIKGKTKITVLSPDGSVEVMEVNGGEGAFAPPSYFHNIENVGTEDVEVIAYFNDANPDYIGIGEVMGSYSNEVLASIFNVPESYFDQFKKPEVPLVIVPV